MTHHASRRGLAALAAAAALAGGALTTVSTAAAAADDPARQEGQKLLGLELLTLLLNVTLGTVSSVQTLISGLTAADLGDALQGASVAQLDKLIPAAQANGQLDDALDTLTPTENGDLLAQLTGSTLATALGALDASELTGALGTLAPSELTQIVGGLTPAQITGLLGAGGSASVIDGLLGSATGLGGTPGTAQINLLTGQLTALLGGGIPAAGDLTDLASLLGIVNPLLAQTGVDRGLLSSLLATVNAIAAIAPAPIAGPLQNIVSTVNGVLNPATGGGGTTGGATTPGGETTPGATTAPIGPPGAATTAGPGATAVAQPAAKPGPYRATIGTIKLSAKRTSMRFTLGCPVSAPKGCLVQLSAKIAGQKAIRTTTVALSSGTSTPVTVTLSKSTTKRLKQKGGSLTVTAKTALSTLGASTQSVKVKRPKAKRRAATR